MPLLKTLTVALLVIASYSSLVHAAPRARLGVSPDRYMVEFDAAGGQTHSLMVKNLSTEALTVALTVGNWDIGDDNRIREIPPMENSLDQWIVINPLTVTIPPDSPQTFRWAILPRQQPSDGEYRAIIFVEEVLKDVEQQQDSASIRLKLRYGIPIYAHYGKAVDKGIVESVRAGGQDASVVMALRNAGNRHARLQGHYAIWPASEFPGSEAALKQMTSDEEANTTPLQEIVLLPGTEREVGLQPALPGPGAYTLQFDATFGGATLTHTVTLESTD